MDVQLLPDRDMERSAFGDIMSSFEGVSPGFLAAVFFDREGETIDYHTRMSMFATRLLGAYLVVIAHTVTRLLDTGLMGTAELLEIHATGRDSVTVFMGDDLYFTVLLKSGNLNSLVFRKIHQIVLQLKAEIGD